jgi:hypothetical protein
MSGKNKYICIKICMPTKPYSIDEINKLKPLYSKLRALEYTDKHVSKSGVTKSMVKCKCECLNICTVVVSDFIRGNPYSCGCVKRGKEKIYKYGGSLNKRLHQVWADMIGRTTNINHASYLHYGAKGCIVCNEWKEYDCFAEWALNNGYDNNKQIDKDILGNGKLYSPENCCFVDRVENMNNRSTTVKYNYNGRLLTLSQIAKISGIKYTTLKGRLYTQKKTNEEAIR